MIKHKKIIAMITMLCVFIAMLWISPVTVAEPAQGQIIGVEEVIEEQSVSVTESVLLPETNPEQHTYAVITSTSAPVLAAPVWTSDTIDTLGNGKAFNILYREYNYYYIQYEDSSNALKRGYILMSHTTYTCDRWSYHPIFNPGENSSDVVKNVLYRPHANSAVCGSIDIDEGKTANKTLIVLSRLGNYYFIQYITNTSNNGSQRIKWKRGWVHIDYISVEMPTSISSIGGKNTFYIQNVGTGRYLDIASFTPTNDANINLWDFHGGNTQKWELETHENVGYGIGDPQPTYVTLTTKSSTTDMVLSVRDALSVINTQMELRTKGNPPSKDQEFLIKDSGYTGVNGEKHYVICSRLTGNYLQMGVYADQTGNGGPVLDKYPYVTMYNRWRLIPVNDSVVTKSVRIIYDSTCGYTPSQLEQVFEEAVDDFYTNFSIDFNLVSVSYSSLLNGSSCPNSANGEKCNTFCGGAPSCATTHHKSADRLLALSAADGYYTYRLVGHRLCQYEIDSETNAGMHDWVIGSGERVGNDSITSTLDSPDLICSIQHELSHNLGASHDDCYGYECVLNQNRDKMCNRCIGYILENK